MLPTIPRCASRSMKISETRPSSRRATLVSWGVVLTMRSLVMEGPFHEPPPRARPFGKPRRRTGPRGRSAPRGREGRWWRRLDWVDGAADAAPEQEMSAGIHVRHQFAKRRMRTFRMRPRARKEERTDEPP